MKYCLPKRSKDGWIVLKDKCRDLGMPWITVILRTFASIGFLSLGVIADQVTKMFGFDWIEVWHQWIGFSVSPLLVFII